MKLGIQHIVEVTRLFRGLGKVVVVGQSLTTAERQMLAGARKTNETWY